MESKKIGGLLCSLFWRENEDNKILYSSVLLPDVSVRTELKDGRANKN